LATTKALRAFTKITMIPGLRPAVVDGYRHLDEPRGRACDAGPLVEVPSSVDSFVFFVSAAEGGIRGFRGDGPPRERILAP
jgi:hypothetical protein